MAASGAKSLKKHPSPSLGKPTSSTSRATVRSFATSNYGRGKKKKARIRIEDRTHTMGEKCVC